MQPLIAKAWIARAETSFIPETDPVILREDSTSGASNFVSPPLVGSSSNIFGGLVEDITTPQRGEIQFDVTPPVIGVMPGSDNAIKSEESILPSGPVYSNHPRQGLFRVVGSPKFDQSK